MNATPNAKRMLLSQGLTIKALAEMAGTNYEHTTRIINRGCSCGAKQAKKIADALGATIPELFEIQEGAHNG